MNAQCMYVIFLDGLRLNTTKYTCSEKGTTSPIPARIKKVVILKSTCKSRVRQTAWQRLFKNNAISARMKTVWKMTKKWIIDQLSVQRTRRVRSSFDEGQTADRIRRGRCGDIWPWQGCPICLFELGDLFDRNNLLEKGADNYHYLSSGVLWHFTNHVCSLTHPPGLQGFPIFLISARLTDTVHDLVIFWLCYLTTRDLDHCFLT